MCLIVFEWKPGDRGYLRLVANRDEFHARAAAPLAFWKDMPSILGGRDLQAGGTWLGLSRSGRLAAITNVREIQAAPKNALSRGKLVSDFLSSQESAADFISRHQSDSQRFPGFNLLLLSEGTLHYWSNRGPDSEHGSALAAGRYGLSNAGLDSPWPKLSAACEQLARTPAEAPAEELLSVTGRRESFPDDSLPDTGIGIEAERLLSPPFIVSPRYGTRCTTVVQWNETGAQVLERRFNSRGSSVGDIAQTLRWDGPR